MRNSYENDPNMSSPVLNINNAKYHTRPLDIDKNDMTVNKSSTFIEPRAATENEIEYSRNFFSNHSSNTQNIDGKILNADLNLNQEKNRKIIQNMFKEVVSTPDSPKSRKISKSRKSVNHENNLNKN